MALSQGSSALWSDINALYTTLRSIQSKHGLTQTAIPSGAAAGGQILTTHITPINSALDAMKSHSDLVFFYGVPGIDPSTGLICRSYTAVNFTGAGTNPTRGSLITPAIINQIKTKLDNLAKYPHVETGNSSFRIFDFGITNSSFGSSDSSFGVGNPGFGFGDNQCQAFGNS